MRPFSILLSALSVVLLSGCTITTQPNPQAYDLICLRNDTAQTVRVYYWTDQWLPKQVGAGSYTSWSWKKTSPDAQAVTVKLDHALTSPAAWRNYTLRSQTAPDTECSDTLTRYVVSKLPGNEIGIYTRR